MHGVIIVLEAACIIAIVGMGCALGLALVALANLIADRTGDKDD